MGAPKAGTTSLAAWLGEHPDVFWSVPKEPFFWSTDLPAQRRFYGFDNRQAYAELYACPEAQSARWRGDASTTYLYSGSAVPAIEAEMQARYVVCLREPSSLVVSYHRTQVLARNEDEHDLRLAWRRALGGGQAPDCALDPTLVDYPLIGAQGEAVRRLLTMVPRERVFFVLLDDLAGRPLDVLADLYGWLGVDVAFRPDLDPRNEGGLSVRWEWVHRLANRPPAPLGKVVTRLRQWSRTTSLPGVLALKSALWVDRSPTAAPSPAMLSELRQHFSDDVALLGAVTGLDLSPWHYPTPAT